MSTFEKIREIISAQLDIDEEEIMMTTHPADDLSADSLDLFQIVNDIEDTFSITIDEDQMTIETIADLVKFVDENR
ncbi:MAG: acyl carrier protein [Aerococcus sp.]|nr:acyl carrier protein [Aerococcus sp.]